MLEFRYYIVEIRVSTAVTVRIKNLDSSLQSEIYNLKSSIMKVPPSHHLIAHTDGGARGNPGPAGYGVVIHDSKGKRVAGLSKYVGRQTNNFAEYQALIGALEYAIENHHKALKVVSDSELMVRQIKGIYKVKEPTLRDLHTRATELISKLQWF